MLDSASMLDRAQDALEDLARVTGIAYSAKPEIGAMPLFSDHRENVHAMKVTGLDADGSVERVNPFGDPPMTAREFIDAAALAEAAVYALYFPGHSHRITARAQVAGRQSMAEADTETDPARNQAASAESCEICLPIEPDSNIDLMHDELDAQLECAMRQGTPR